MVLPLNFYIDGYKANYTDVTFSPCFSVFKRFHNVRLAEGSIPDDGSSNITTLEPPHSAIATHSFLFIPPDKSQDLVSIYDKRGNESYIQITKASTAKVTS